MEPLLGAKIGCLFALLVLTLVCGLIPIYFKWFQTATATGCHRRILSFLGCTSAGVFLGAGFMHMTAEALEGIKSEIQNLMIQNRTKSEGHSDDDADSAYSSAVKKPPSTQETRVRSLGGEEPLEKEMAAHYGIFAWKIPWNLAGYGPEDRKQLGMTEHKRSTLCHLTTAFCSHQMEYPYGELVISLGFFLVFLLESLALQCCPGTAETPKVQEQELGTAHELEPHSHGLLPSPSRGPFRALILLLSLSFHSVFEGLAVGLQLTVASTVQLCLAVLAHKGIVVFGVGLRLVQVGTESRWAVLSILSLALMSPLGLAIGLAVPQGDSKAGQGLAQALLEGMAAGTFLYVTFLEILPRELASPEAPLAKWSCVAAGFAFMAVIALWA